MTADSDASASDQMPSNNTTAGSASPLEKVMKVYDEDNIPIIK